MHLIRYKTSLLTVILTLMLSMGVFSVPAFASTGETEAEVKAESETETLTVNAAWLDGETVRIDVTDKKTGTNSSLALPLKDYLKDGDNSEFISIQAVDLEGKHSGVIEIKNPFYNPNLPQTVKESDSKETETSTTSAVDAPNTNTNLRPFTPNGTGTVVDNVDNTDEKEFFTISSVDGNEFYLIVDRQKGKENVYFLNAVTEEDLMSLSQQNKKNGSSAIKTPTIDSNTDSPIEISDGENQPKVSTPQQPNEEASSSSNRIGNNLMIMIVIAVVVGGLAYYIKVVRPKKNAYNDDDEDEYGIDEALDEEVEDFEDNGGEE